MKPRNYIARHVRNNDNKLIATLVARKRNNGTVLITYSVCNSMDAYSKRLGIQTALKKTSFTPLINHRPAAQAKLDVVRQWLPQFVEQASKFFNTSIPSPI